MPLLFYSRLFGDDAAVQGGGGGSAPSTPTLSITDNGNGTGAVATISGADLGSSNTVEVVAVGAGGHHSWSTFGPRSGNGTVALSLTSGRYLAACYSSVGGLPSVNSDPYIFSVTDSSVSRTVTPAGNFPTALAGLAWLVASSSNFQDWVGAGDAAAAMAHVSFESDDTEESGSTRPRAIIVPARGGWTEEKVNLVEFRPRLSLLLSFEANPSDDVAAEQRIEDRLFDEQLEFTNKVQAIVDDMKAAQGLGSGYGNSSQFSQISFHTIRLHAGPGAVEEVRAEGQNGEVSTYFWGIILEVGIRG